MVFSINKQKQTGKGKLSPFIYNECLNLELSPTQSIDCKEAARYIKLTRWMKVIK